SREVGVSAAPWCPRGLEHGNHPVRFSPPRTKSSGDLPVARRTVAHEQATGLLATKGGPFNEREFDEHELASGSSRVTRPVAWDRVTHADVLRAIREYDRVGPQRFFSKHGFAPTTTYELVWDERRYPPKAILGTAYELATGERLASGGFEGGKTGAVKILGQLGFRVQAIRRSAK